MKLPDQIKWIFFDVGGVLVDESKALDFVRDTLAELLLPINTVATKEAITAYWPIASTTNGPISHEVIRHFVSDPARAEEIITQSREIIGQKYSEFSFVRAEAVPVLKTLSDGYKLGLMGNQPQSAIEKLRQGGILDFFTHQKISAHYGFIKPNPEFFKAVLKDSGATAEESVIIDDNIERGLMPAKN